MRNVICDVDYVNCVRSKDKIWVKQVQKMSAFSLASVGFSNL